MFSVCRLKAAHRHNAGHYECSADFVPAEAAEDTRPRRDSGLDLSRGIFIDVLCKLSSVLQQPAFFSVMRDPISSARSTRSRRSSTKR